MLRSTDPVTPPLQHSIAGASDLLLEQGTRAGVISKVSGHFLKPVCFNIRLTMLFIMVLTRVPTREVWKLPRNPLGNSPVRSPWQDVAHGDQFPFH